MTMERIALHSNRVVLEDQVAEATVILNGEKIDFVEWGFARSKDFVTEDLGDAVIMPGLIDSHVHINEPGRTEWEGFNTATRSAAKGGITTLIDMPLNSNPVTTNREALDLKLASAKNNLHVNCGFYGGLIPGNRHHLKALCDAGVFGIKAFLTHSGIDDFPNVLESDLRMAMPLLKEAGATLLVHAELESLHADQGLLEKNPRSYGAYLKSRPRQWEDDAIQLMISLCREFDLRTHIVHLSSSNAIAPLMKAIRDGLPLSVETCPHYLFFNAEDIHDGQTLFKCAPPIREKNNNDALWSAVKDGLISFIVTDHSPTLPALRELESGDFKKAWGGIAGLEFSLPAFWTKARDNGFNVMDVASLMSSRVAQFLGLENQKGKIAPGFDADLTVWNPEKEFRVTCEGIEFRHKVTPYEGQVLKGVVERTYVAGNKVFGQGKITSLNKGKILTRKYNG